MHCILFAGLGKGEVLIEMISSEGEYFADGGLERYPKKGQQLFNEIVEQLQ